MYRKALNISIKKPNILTKEPYVLCLRTLCNKALQHAATATHCNTLQQQHTATRCNSNALQHAATATHCNTLQQQRTATRCSALHHATACRTGGWVCAAPKKAVGVSSCQDLQHAATHCNTLQHIATHCNTLQHTATHCNTLQHTATHCNTLQHTTTHCNRGRRKAIIRPTAKVQPKCIS